MEAQNQSDATTPSEGPRPKDARFLSTIQFPYADLDTGIEVVRIINEKCGGVSCSPDLLAAAMGQTPASGNFRLKTSTARIFGLIATAPGNIELTDLGFEILDPAREKAARVQAFLNVELFRRVYEEFKGRQLPPRPAAFELMLERLGVSKKQKDNARRALDNSAGQAGFYEHGKERLVMPNVGALRSQHDPGIKDTNVGGSGGSGGSGGPGGGDSERGGGSGGGGRSREDDSGRHPFIQGLLKTLPEPETTWTVEGRAKWLQAAANIFDLIYKGTGEITVKAKSEETPARNEGQNG